MTLESLDSFGPFGGVRPMNIEVTCRTIEQVKEYFSISSIFARSAEGYTKTLIDIGLVPGQKYTIISVEGHGDLYDVTIKLDGKEVSLMSAFFIDVKGGS